MRLFVAHRIAGEAAGRVARVAAALRSKLPRGAWVGRDAYHLTFAFLGEQSPGDVPRLREALARALEPFGAVEAELAGGGFFPNAQRPRVGWIAIEPHERVEAIARPVRDAVARSGLRFDEKPFRAHLTLVRIREPWRREDADAFVRGVGAEGAIPFRIDRVSLFESRLLPSGAVHEELAGFALR